MTTINNLTLDTPEPTAAKAFHTALGVDAHITARDADAPTTGFPGFTLSLVVSQPNIVDAYIEAALDNGGATITPAKKSLWGYGGVVQGPDGALWKIATSSKKNTGPATLHFEDLVLLLGVGDVKAGKQFYLDHGLEVTRSFGRKYVEFATGPKVKLALYGRRALAKDAGVSPDGTGAHRIVIRSDAGTFTDPDGFSWESD